MIPLEATTTGGLLPALAKHDRSSRQQRNQVVDPIDVFNFADVAPDFHKVPRDRPVCLRGLSSDPALSARLSAEALAKSSLAENPVVLLQGKKPDGTSRRGENLPLGDFLKIETGTAYFGVMFDPDRSVHFLDRFSPAGVEPWNQLLSDAMPKWPLDLIREAPVSSLAEPHYNNSLVLSKGEGLGAPFHQHAPNLYMQVQGEKLWRFFAPDVFAPYMSKQEPQFAGQLAVVDPKYTALCSSVDFKAPEGMPTPQEFITCPGDVVCIPRNWMHATWSLAPYTAALTLHADNDSESQGFRPS